MKNSDILFCAFLKKASFAWNGGGEGKRHHEADPASDGGVTKKVMKRPDAHQENDAKNEDRTSPDSPVGKELETGHLWTGARTVAGSGDGPQAEPDVQGGFKA